MRQGRGRWAVRLGAVLAASVIGMGAARAADPAPWRYGVLDAKSDSGFSFMISRGFAEKQGLKLEMYQFPADTQLLQALVSGQLDAFEGSPGNDIVAVSRGADIKLLGCTWPSLPHVIFSKASIGSVKDLKDRNVASGPAGALPDLLLRIALDKYGVPPGEVHFNSLGNDVERFKALAAGIVDAAVASIELESVAEQQGFKVLIAARDFAPEYARLCIVTTGKTLAARGEDAVRFMAAEIASLRHAVANREETVRLAHEMSRAKEDDPRAGFIFDWAVRTKSLDPEAGMAADKLAYIQDLLVKTGNMKQRIDIAGMLAPQVRDKALARLSQ
jgi:NitT/TauT family transport system substrate-binding protein